MNDPTFVHPYQAAYDLDWPDDYNGNLNPAEVTQRKDEWLFWVNTRHPLTLEIHREMSDEQKGRYRRASIFARAGGLMVVSRGKAKKAFREIELKWMGLAADRAKQARKAAGWRGWNYLTSPTGLSTGANGQRFGAYTLPGDQFDRGMWDGILTDKMSFTV
jgi:hypothetical protein